MIITIQRVLRAAVHIDGSTHASIQHGMVLLVGFEKTDTEAVLAQPADKIAKLRIFEDDNGKMNRSITDVSGEILAIPNFTLAGNLTKGNRPGFDTALAPAKATVLFDQFVSELKRNGLPVETGVFGADMHVEIHNDGPVTFVL